MSYKLLILDTNQPDTLYLGEQLREKSWFFSEPKGVLEQYVWEILN